MNEILTPEDFKHRYSVTVRFHEVDMLGVCNNAVYINFFETARLEYIKAAGLMPEKGIFSDGKIFFMVRNEINYRDHAYYDDLLDVYSRIAYVKNSSFGYDHLVIKRKTGKVIVDGKGVVVFVDPKTRKSTQLPEEFVQKVKSFESQYKTTLKKIETGGIPDDADHEMHEDYIEWSHWVKAAEKCKKEIELVQGIVEHGLRTEDFFHVGY